MFRDNGPLVWEDLHEVSEYPLVVRIRSAQSGNRELFSYEMNFMFTIQTETGPQTRSGRNYRPPVKIENAKVSVGPSLVAPDNKKTGEIFERLMRRADEFVVERLQKRVDETQAHRIQREEHDINRDRPKTKITGKTAKDKAKKTRRGQDEAHD